MFFNNPSPTLSSPAPLCTPSSLKLEAREASGFVSGGAAAPHSPRESRSESSTLRREREEQRRILADTQSAAMDLRFRLEHSERDWLREKAELLERFDVERREWENQLKDMQRKLEEVRCYKTLFNLEYC